MALFLKDPSGNVVQLKHFRLCCDSLHMIYITMLLIRAGVYDFYEKPKSHWSGYPRKHKMCYDKLAAEWRRLGRRFSAEVEPDQLKVRVWDCRKLVVSRPSGSVGVLAFLLELNEGDQKHFVGYYGTLSELAGLNR